jgi:hypothetical protein
MDDDKTGRNPTGNGTEQKPADKSNSPPDPKGAEKATQDNDLTTGHSELGDGGDDNA